MLLYMSGINYVFLELMLKPYLPTLSECNLLWDDGFTSDDFQVKMGQFA